MKKIELEMQKYNSKDLKAALKRDYVAALKNPEFKKIVSHLKIKEDLALKYTSGLEMTATELQNCNGCKSIFACQNKVTGFVYYPQIDEERLTFNYVACKYKKKIINEEGKIKSEFYQMPLEIRRAKMADIDVKDAKRVSIIKWLTKFHKDYRTNKNLKGLFLHGSFGSGKTYLISALLNELSKEDCRVIIIYYPELLRSLKEAFETNFGERIMSLKQADLLLLDDIGAETVTAWNRDEILGTILQYRMDNKLPTFFTSNLNLKELENHFIMNKNGEEQIKARRIIERIKQITESLELVSENRRK